MARKKPYTVTLGIIDVILICITGGAWLIVMLARELYQRS